MVRTNQKLRTRAALVAAAGELLRDGRTPTVADAAERAQVSRATAYRYFPTQQALLSETVLDLVMPDADDVVAPAGDDPLDRLDAVVRVIHAVVADNEAAFRSMLVSSLQADEAPRRGGRRLAYAERALGPGLEGAPPELRERAVAAVAAFLGIETRIVLQDICGLGERRALRVERWAVRTLAAAALAEAAAPPGSHDRR